ncbi:MAG: DUF1552 domain-containing protein [Myxococcales bacterium]|nr:DUF1552 domain-containing protein [Myxococcales bacterium]
MTVKASRRQFLRSAASTLWLPFLPSIAPKSAWAAPATDPKRLLIYFVPNGLMIGDTDRSSVVDPHGLLTALDPFDKRRLIVTGATNTVDFWDHEACTPSLLSDVEPKNFFNGPFDVGITCDQVAARQVGGETPFPSLQLGAKTQFEPISPHGRTYSARLSWSAAETPLPPTEVPKQLFDSMFAGYDAEATAEELERRANMRKSVLDSVVDHVGDLERKLNPADRAKLDQYTTSVRELEQRLEQLEENACPVPEPPGTSLSYKGTVEAMTDLMVVALQCDYSRIITFMSAPSSSYMVYDFADDTIRRNHHEISHSWRGNDNILSQLHNIMRYHVDVVANLCDRLQETPANGDGDLLSNTLVVLTSEFTEPDYHDSQPLPFVLMGGESGGVLSGRHIDFPERPPHSNLLRSLIRYTGADPSGFGPNATGEIDLSA